MPDKKPVVSTSCPVDMHSRCLTSFAARLGLISAALVGKERDHRVIDRQQALPHCQPHAVEVKLLLNEKSMWRVSRHTAATNPPPPRARA
jgi:hypothetical protein